MSKKSSKTKNKPIIETLVETCLTPKEAAVYVASLNLDGGGAISEISDLCGLPRTTCYPLIKSLISKHFMDSYIMGKRRIYCPTNPDHLVDFMNSKVKKFEEIIPLLKANYSGESSKKPRIALYEGVEKMLTVHHDLLSGKYKLSRTITPVEKILELFTPEIVKLYIEKRNAIGLRSRVITFATPAGLKWKENDSKENRVTKLIPNTKALLFNSMLMVYGDKFVIMDMDGDRPFALEITNSSIAETCQKIFDLMWKRL